MAQDGGTHDAWLYGDVQVRLLEDRRWMFVQNLTQGNEFGMASSLENKRGQNNIASVEES